MGMLLRRHYKQGGSSFSDMTVRELKTIAKEQGIEGYSTLDKESLISLLER